MYERPPECARRRCISRMPSTDSSASGPHARTPSCTGWIVHVDRESYERYGSLSDGPLQKLLTDHLVRIEPEIATENWFATIRMREDGFCPLLDQNRLCRVRQETGPDALVLTCRQYPRHEQTIDGLLEVPLMLSCPEAARVVLLDPERPGTRRAQTMQITWDDTLTAPKPIASGSGRFEPSPSSCSCTARIPYGSECFCREAFRAACKPSRAANSIEDSLPCSRTLKPRWRPAR